MLLKYQLVNIGTCLLINMTMTELWPLNLMLRRSLIRASVVKERFSDIDR